jgi:hypothetical protein
MFIEKLGGTPSSSIGEAVAKATLLEAETKASKHLMEGEMTQMKKKYKDELTEAARIAEVAITQRIKTEDLLKAATQSSIDNAAEVHPILGPVLHDFGYKKVFAVDSNLLTTLEVWEKQRSYRHDRAQIIANDKPKSPISMALGLPGVITLYDTGRREEKQEDGSVKIVSGLSVLDGQHRLGMCAVINLKEGERPEFLKKVLVEVYSLSTEDARNNAAKRNNSSSSASLLTASILFTEINKAEPIKGIDMPDTPISKDHLEIINAGTKMLKDYRQFGLCFKPTSRFRQPHVNLDSMRDEIYNSDLVKRNKIRSETELFDFLMARNEEIQLKFESKAAVGKLSDQINKKVKATGFYLGIENGWQFY